MTVSTATVQRVDWNTSLEASGAVAAWQEAIISARASGLALAEVLADVGNVVQRNQVLARFDDRTIRADVTQAEATLAQAVASARQAALNRDRTLMLKSSGAVSDQDILQAITTAETADAQVAQSKAALVSVRVRLENTVVIAPDAGVITARTATLGQVSNTGGELFRLIRQNRLEWRAELPAQQLGLVRFGMSVKVNLPDGTEATGRVRQISPALDATTRLGLVYADLQTGSRAKASMYVNGRIEQGNAQALVVPGESVVIRDGRSYVFRLDGTKVARVAVSTGRRQGNMVEIAQGLEPNQRIAVRGAGFLSDGDTVQIADSVAAASATTATTSATSGVAASAGKRG